MDVIIQQGKFKMHHSSPPADDGSSHGMSRSARFDSYCQVATEPLFTGVLHESELVWRDVYPLHLSLSQAW